MSWSVVYVLALGGSALLGCALTAAARMGGHRYGVLDRPTDRKNHTRSVPVTGGWAIFGTFFLMAGLGGLGAPALAGSMPEAWDPIPQYMRNLAGVRTELLGILGGAAWIFTVGAIDDVKPLGPRFKLIAQILAVVPPIVAGVTIRGFLPYPVLGWALTIGWTLLLMNSLNFMDNMDGLCATVAGTIAVVLAIAAAQGGELWLPVLFLSFAGTMAGFLIFNFHPASIFLGDSGALTIGYLLAMFSIMTTFYQGDQPSGLPVLIPLAVLGVPIFDTASVMFIRWRNGAPLMVGDRNHFSHRLQAMGFSVRQTAVTIGLLTGAVGLLALPLRYLHLGAALTHLFAITLLFLVIGALEFFGRARPGA